MEYTMSRSTLVGHPYPPLSVGEYRHVLASRRRQLDYDAAAPAGPLSRREARECALVRDPVTFGPTNDALDAAVRYERWGADHAALHADVAARVAVGLGSPDDAQFLIRWSVYQRDQEAARAAREQYGFAVGAVARPGGVLPATAR
jgi:hypothetical protein